MAIDLPLAMGMLMALQTANGSCSGVLIQVCPSHWQALFTAAATSSMISCPIAPPWRPHANLVATAPPPLALEGLRV